MKKLTALVFAWALLVSVPFIGSAISATDTSFAAGAQTVETATRKTYAQGKYVTKKVYVDGKRVTKKVWVGSYAGGKYVTKKVYVGGKRVTKKVWVASESKSKSIYKSSKGVVNDTKKAVY